MEIDPIIKQAIEIGIKLGIEATGMKGMQTSKTKRFLSAGLMQKDVLVVELSKI